MIAITRMMTFKQLEALYWIVELGGFAAAARKLNTTQSAISKRISELELTFTAQLFDRTQRSAQLTEAGHQMAALATNLLEQRDIAVEKFARLDVIRRRVRIGLTELTAMTWLPLLVRQIQQKFPGVVIEPDVDLTEALREKVLAGDLDLAIVPDAVEHSRLLSTQLSKVRFRWMCRPGLTTKSGTVSLRDLAEMTWLVQGERSGTGLIYERWFKAHKIDAVRVIRSDSLVAVIGMTVAGLGVSYLPERCVAPLVAGNLLEVLKVRPGLPDVQYVVLRRTGGQSALIEAITNLAVESCDFSQMFRDLPS
jgi:DNA-binding transcriptional LysR family regulator